MTIPYFIPDTSPIFNYSPCVNCASGSSWQSAYSARGDGYDTTFHQTAKADSIISFNITASSIELKTGQDGGQCDAAYSLDGGDFTDGCTISDLSKDLHQVEVRPANGSDSFRFYGVSGDVQLGGKGSYANSTIDDQAPVFTYSGQWTMINANGPLGTPSNNTLVRQYSGSGMTGFFNSTTSITTDQGASISLSFKGTGLYIYGMSGLDGGSAEVTYDGDLTHTLNLTNPWRAYPSLLYFVAGLDPSDSHTVDITNTSPGKQLVIDYALLTTPTKSKSTNPNLGLIIGTISGVSLFLLIISVLAYLYISQRRTARRGNTGTPYGIHVAGSYRDISSAKVSSIDSWRKNAVAVTPASPTSFSGSHSGSGSSSGGGGGGRYFAHVQPGSTAARSQIQAISPGRSPPPEYPDYLPYRGPIEPRSVPMMEYEATSPPAIAGFDQSAQGWLTRVNSMKHTTSPTRPPPAENYQGRRTSRSLGRHIHRPDPIPLRNRDHQDLEDIPLDNYQPQSSIISPASTLSSLGLGGMTSRAMGATRSVARLYPNPRDAVPSSTVLPMTTSTSSPPESSIPIALQTPLSSLQPSPPIRALSSDSTQYLPTYMTAGNCVSSPDQIIGSGPTSHALRSAPDFPQSTYTNPSSPPTTLRRGVSIKSVKTMRSFFSGLLFNGGNVGIPDTPAIPTTALETPAARPDSDIFPSGGLSRNNSYLTREPSRVKSRDRSRERERYGEGGSTRPSGPPLLRLDMGNGAGHDDQGGNLFIELDVNSSINMGPESRPGSEMAPTSWRY